MMITDDFLDVRQFQTSQVFIETMERLEKEFGFIGSEQAHNFTGAEFTRLYRMVEPFYQHHYPVLIDQYVPLFVSMWKMKLGDVLELSNMHQDGGIQYFGRNGYESRMINLWTCLYKDHSPDLDDDELGIYVVESRPGSNHSLYKALSARNTHFYQSASNELLDIRQIDDAPVRFSQEDLKKRYFAYKQGTTIQFNSHLLHGSKPFQGNPDELSPDQLKKFRVALTSVWVHRDDFNFDIMRVHQNAYEPFYLEGVAEARWADIKKIKNVMCEKEITRINTIKGLIEASKLMI